MANSFIYKNATVKIYHGYGHTHNLVIYGHVFKNKTATRRKYSTNALLNSIHLMRLFFVKPLAGANVQLQWRNQVVTTTSQEDGFFTFDWESDEEVSAGWHPVTVNVLDEQQNSIVSSEGKVFVPHITQYGFISDIDDTVLISHSATIGKRLRVLFSKNPRTRKAFANVVRFYEMLAIAHTTLQVPNPFFYVSSSEWNLYDDLDEFFKFNGLPKGIFLLSQLKRWFELLKTGKTKHEGKLLRVVRILKAFPNQQFILLGDNTQSDPGIYSSLAEKYEGKIFAVYIRNIHPKNEVATKKILSEMEKLGVHTCLFNDNAEAIEHAKKIGLIEVV